MWKNILNKIELDKAYYNDATVVSTHLFILSTHLLTLSTYYKYNYTTIATVVCLTADCLTN